MAFTIDQLSALETAIGQGVLRVQYKDRLVEYASLKDLLAARDIVQADINKQNGKVSNRQVRIYTSKGFNHSGGPSY